jgi:uncharacterized damage-inducible protein DinB
MNADLRSQLERSAARLATAFAAAPEALARAYAPGKWTGRQVLLHIVDVESVFHDRLKRVLADAKPLYWGIDPDRWTARLTYPERSLAIAAGLFAAQRAALNELLSVVSEAEWERAGVRSKYGRLTWRDLATRVAGHANHHLDQVEAALAGRTWTPGT